jgi:hypothetical protein
MRAKAIKKSFKLSEWVSPGGKTFLYQGYELFAIKYLIQSGIDENDIFTEYELCANGMMPEFIYEFEGKKCRYYPDIYIKTLNKFIEVKSEYTFNREPERLMAKTNCVFFADYGIETMIFNADGSLNQIDTP